MQLGSNVTNHWYSKEQGMACERLARHIAEAFPELDHIELNDIDHIPSVELCKYEGVLTPAKVLEFGRRLCAVVGDYPVRFHLMRSSDVTFLVVHDLLATSYGDDEHVEEYGTPFEDLEKAWSA